jgi:hypothetical protein
MQAQLACDTVNCVPTDMLHPKEGRGQMGKVTVLIGLAGGAGAMYLLDREHGRERRARLTEEMQRLREKLSDEEGHVDPRDILNRTKESVSDLRHRLTNGQREKVTSEIRGAASGLGSTGRWSPGTRLLAAGVGSGLALYGIRRTSLIGLGMTAAGLGLLARAIANFELRRPSEEFERDPTAGRQESRDPRSEELRTGMSEQPSSRRPSDRTKSELTGDLDDATTAQDMRDRISEERAAFTESPETLPSD